MGALSWCENEKILNDSILTVSWSTTVIHYSCAFQNVCIHGCKFKVWKPVCAEALSQNFVSCCATITKKHGFALLQFPLINLKICLLHLSSDSSRNILYEICLPNLQLLSCSCLTSWQQQCAGLLFPCFMFCDRLHTVIMGLSEKQDQWRDLAPIWVWINGLHAQPGLHQVPFSDNWTRAWMWEDRGWEVL